MKQLYIFITGLLVIFSSCKKTEVMSYDEPARAYFLIPYEADSPDTLNYTFAIKPDMLLIDTVRLPVRIMGAAATTDRIVGVQPVADSTSAVAGQDYLLLPTVVKAGAFTGNVQVVLKRNATMKTKLLRLSLQIVPSADFQPGVDKLAFKNGWSGAKTRFRIRFSDMLTKPDIWDAVMASFFGKYSATKYKFIIDVTGVSEFSRSIPYGAFSVYKTLCQEKLAAYELTNGPLVDENGERVSF
ncbi:DUF4843 domain-containing protein [Chitinophaga flava]|nr:DUF4843 domain-containing protein [Chitinophaga flava]